MFVVSFSILLMEYRFSKILEHNLVIFYARLQIELVYRGYCIVFNFYEKKIAFSVSSGLFFFEVLTMRSSPFDL